MRRGGAAGEPAAHTRSCLTYFLPLGLFAAWVRAEAAIDFEALEDFGFDRALLARVATFGEVFSLRVAIILVL